MTGSEYQALAMRTSNTALTSRDHLINGVMGLNGEAGEVIDIVKKAEFQSHMLEVTKVVDECSDVCWYLAEIANAIGVTIDDFFTHNIKKLKKRYPEGFSAERSINR